MPSVTTIPLTDACPDREDHDECPDCGNRFDSTTDPGCETCNDQWAYDNRVDWCNDTRRDAWEDNDNWAGDHGYADCDD